MLDSLVRVSRRVLRVPETESSQTETRTVRDCTAATTGAPRRSPHIGRTSTATLPCVGPDAPKARARFTIDTVRRPVGVHNGPTANSEEVTIGLPNGTLRPTSNGSRCITKREVHAVPVRRNEHAPCDTAETDHIE
ncbi:unnamed protein product [Diatraea saccharalis]|uniref:Uncharacterized protein n=1 Tax=Diatraea saccharalis TaxID=40085 RepID=A0A9N9R6L3_9NEOP|nr:unnamed protein product [Diatraea saccharalis]